MDETIIPSDAEFRIQLPTFEGPLDLLLHLIKKHELNILDLPIAFVTERYLDYLGMMQELDLDVASEYLLMAATLAHIKSKMLLPQVATEEAEEQDDGYIADPRGELIRRLLEYQKYKAAAEHLGGRPIVGRDVFGRGLQTQEASGPAPLAPIDLYKLLDAFGAILKRVQGRVALEVTAEAITINERMSQLSELLRERRSCRFEELFAGDRTRYEVVVTFLALLEMTKLRMTRVYQADPKSPIHIQYALLDADASAADGGEQGAVDAGLPPSAAEVPEAVIEQEAVAEAVALEADAFEDEAAALEERDELGIDNERDHDHELVIDHDHDHDHEREDEREDERPENIDVEPGGDDSTDNRETLYDGAQESEAQEAGEAGEGESTSGEDGRGQEEDPAGEAGEDQAGHDESSAAGGEEEQGA